MPVITRAAKPIVPKLKAVPEVLATLRAMTEAAYANPSVRSGS